MVVVLPAPFGPRKPVTMPGSTMKESSSTATASRYRLVSSLTSITAVTIPQRGPKHIGPRSLIPWSEAASGRRG